MLDQFQPRKIENCIQSGDEIITSSLNFASVFYSILEVGAIPVLVDVDLDTLNMNVKQI